MGSETFLAVPKITAYPENISEYPKCILFEHGTNPRHHLTRRFTYILWLNKFTNSKKNVLIQKQENMRIVKNMSWREFKRTHQEFKVARTRFKGELFWEASQSMYHIVLFRFIQLYKHCRWHNFTLEWMNREQY